MKKLQLHFEEVEKDKVYTVYKKKFFEKFQKLGTAHIVLYNSYSFDPFDSITITPEELSSIKEQCRKLSKIDGNNINTQII